MRKKQSDMLKAALKYQRRGLSVFPCGRNKKPLIDTWMPYQTKHATDEEIKEWFMRWPDANIAIVTGDLSGICVIDVDSQKGLEAINEILPDSCPRVKTPSGGWHFYCKQATGFRNNSRIIPDCDLRAEGGFVVAPPSVNEEGIAWEWHDSLDEVLLPDVPQSYLEYIKANKKEAADGAEGDRFIKGRRNEDVFHIANVLAKDGLPKDITEDAVRAVAAKCAPPLAEKEALGAVESAYKRHNKVDKPEGDLVFVKAKDLTAQRRAINWIWKDRIPGGMLTMFVGDAGVGKGLLGCTIAAHISTGKKWPDLPVGPEPADCIIISTEDIFTCILEPRLAAAGANLDRIELCSYFLNEREEKKNVDLTKHIPNIERKIRKMLKDGLKPRLILLDPILSLLSPRMDDNRAIEVRATMTPLIRLAEDIGSAVVPIQHLSKDQTKSALYRPAGSHAWVALARAVWLVAKDPEDAKINAKNPLRVVSPLKLNIAKDPGALVFSIGETTLQDCEGKYIEVPVLNWQKDVRYDYDNEELIGPRQTKNNPGPDPYAQEEAAAFLKELFSTRSEIPANEISEAAELKKINERTLQRAKKANGYKSDKRKKPKGEEYWVWIRPL
jgi:hypothetical protein